MPFMSFLNVSSIFCQRFSFIDNEPCQILPHLPLISRMESRLHSSRILPKETMKSGAWRNCVAGVLWLHS